MTTRRQTPAKKVPQKSVPASLFFGRDESWLRFNQRVLEEAQDATNPLLERVKFLAITASNLDEFVEIRVASLLQRIEEGHNEAQAPDEGGLTLTERLDLLSAMLQDFVAAQYACWNEKLLPALKAEKIRFLRWSELNETQLEHAESFYENEVDPILTPVTIDPSHPFPRVLNKALCIALLLRHKRKGNTMTMLGVVTVPRSLPRVVALPSTDGHLDFMFLHEMIESQVARMFRGYEVMGSSAFRVTRNSNLYMQEEESRSVLESVRAELHNRRKGDAVRLEIETTAMPEIIERLRTNFELDPWQVFQMEGPVNLSRLMNLYSAANCASLKYPVFKSKKFKLSKKSMDIFDELRQHDIMLHHPFDSYETVEGFVESAAVDPSVVSMKQTLYRTSADSPMFRALTEAAQSKDVTVVIELMARFDEASNIRWARDLEDAGVGVFHGIFGLKTHCKLALLVRRDPDGKTRRYAHLGTGNYNPVTARFYTDISLLTSNPEITAAVQSVFRYLTAEADGQTYKPLLVAPLTMAGEVIDLIHRETEHARAGRPSGIVAKMNALLDRKTVEAMYTASQAGVPIDLIIRGMCSLRPGVKGLSETIRVRSVVGRFLEHSRIFSFKNGGNDEIFCGSADWMPRNLYERCEVLFPVLDKHLAKRLREEILGAYLKDNLKARILQPDGIYTRPTKNGHHPFSAQEYLMALASEEITEIPAKIAAKKADKKAEQKVKHSAKKAEKPAAQEEEPAELEPQPAS
ncbi:polyphosphate kinase 1 [Granulicella sibirica]|uniref:Polyphosphate kinase n=1 Tax=Granulicella sibirica TaxID=2479048 RepID=A0A4Q0T0B3_9BACT|nr:polyphosphate kinase 1 [Granulicella sibirica]RXH56142.1 Polyphosphate kinase [Granulicella sibirica]